METDNKMKIKALVIEMLNDSHNAMVMKLDKLLPYIYTKGWDEQDSPMILPKCIATALLEYESQQYSGKGTSFEKQVSKEVKRLKYYL